MEEMSEEVEMWSRLGLVLNLTSSLFSTCSQAQALIDIWTLFQCLYLWEISVIYHRCAHVNMRAKTRSMHMTAISLRVFLEAFFTCFIDAMSFSSTILS